MKREREKFALSPPSTSSTIALCVVSRLYLREERESPARKKSSRTSRSLISLFGVEARQKEEEEEERRNKRATRYSRSFSLSLSRSLSGAQYNTRARRDASLLNVARQCRYTNSTLDRKPWAGKQATRRQPSGIYTGARARDAIMVHLRQAGAQVRSTSLGALFSITRLKRPRRKRPRACGDIYYFAPRHARGNNGLLQSNPCGKRGRERERERERRNALCANCAWVFKVRLVEPVSAKNRV